MHTIHVKPSDLHLHAPINSSLTMVSCIDCFAVRMISSPKMCLLTHLLTRLIMQSASSADCCKRTEPSLVGGQTEVQDLIYLGKMLFQAF